jgi:hypothetical protein
MYGFYICVSALKDFLKLEAIMYRIPPSGRHSSFLDFKLGKGPLVYLHKEALEI